MAVTERMMLVPEGMRGSTGSWGGRKGIRELVSSRKCGERVESVARWVVVGADKRIREDFARRWKEGGWVR
jgi:hypothetical protein